MPRGDPYLLVSRPFKFCLNLFQDWNMFQYWNMFQGSRAFRWAFRDPWIPGAIGPPFCIRFSFII